MTPSQEARQVKRVISRLTRQPVTTIERKAIHELFPGTHARWITGPPKRFLRDLQCAEMLTSRQRVYLWGLIWRYRARVNSTIREHAWCIEYERRQAQGRLRLENALSD